MYEKTITSEIAYNGGFIKTEKCAISEYEKYDAKYIVGPEPDPDIPYDILQGIIDGTIDLDDWLSGKYDEPEEKEEEDDRSSSSSSHRD